MAIATREKFKEVGCNKGLQFNSACDEDHDGCGGSQQCRMIWNKDAS